MADLAAITADALAEHDDLRAILAGIPDGDWERPTPAAGWTVRDQLSHLAYFDGAARQSIAAPDAALWEWGPSGAADRVKGSALDFALVVTQRRLAGGSDLVVEGDDARTWMAFAQAFAGNPTDTDPGRAGL